MPHGCLSLVSRLYQRGSRQLRRRLSALPRADRPRPRRSPLLRTAPQLSLFFQRGQRIPVGKVTTIGSAMLTALSDKDLSHSSITIRVNHSDWFLGHVEQPFRARVMLGSLSYASRSTNFLATRPSQSTLVATNKFAAPLTFLSASVGSEITGAGALPFTVSFDPAAVGTVVQPGAAFPPVTVAFAGAPVDPLSPKIQSVPLGFQTDSALIFVPLTVYHNRLLCSASEDGGGKYAPCGEANSLAFGAVAAGERRERKIFLLNPNPLAIEVAKIWSTLDEVVTLQLRAHTPKTPNKVPPRPANASAAAAVSESATHYVIPSGFTATLTVSLNSSWSETSRSGAVKLQLASAGSLPGELLSFPVSYRSVSGVARLKPSKLLFAPAFPGKQPMPEVELSFSHNFSSPVRITGVTSADGRFYVVPGAASHSAVTSVPRGSPHRIATVRFDPSRLFDARHNYMSNQLHSAGAGASDFWLDEDLLLLRQREAAWKLLSPDDTGTAGVVSQLVVKTDVAKRLSVEVRGQLVWPQVVRPTQYFGAAELGVSMPIPIVVTNPSHEPLNVALLPHLAPTSPGRMIDTDAMTHPADFSVSGLVRSHHAVVVSSSSVYNLLSRTPSRIPPTACSDGHEEHMAGEMD